MNSGAVSGVITAALLALFGYGCFWAWSIRRKPDFDEAARLPLDDESEYLNKERQP